MTKNNLGGGIVACALALAAFVSSTQAQNGIEPRYERYNADRKSIEVDGNLDDWAGVNFIEPLFEASDGREGGKGNTTIGETTYSTFAEFAGGTWSGPDDHKTSIAVAWDQEGLYLGIVVTDDEHEHAANNAWNGDGVQMGLTNPERDTVTHLYNYAIKAGYESGKVYKGGDAGAIADKERGPGNYTVAMVRNDDTKKTIYEALFTPDSFGFSQFEVGQQFGFGVCVNDGDNDTPGQKGWSGWGPHMIVFGKTAPDAALVTLTAAEVLASFETSFTEGEIPDSAELFGVATIGPDENDEADEPNEFLHVTDALNGQNGSMKIGDITGGRTFKDFEVGFKVYISDSTCCGDADDFSEGHRPADGWSLSIGNDLPDTIGLAEEGAGSGIRICFDTWDSGGGEAPAIDVWNGVQGQVGDGNQGAWSGGLFVRQNFGGVTGASDESKFKDPDTGELVFMWTHGEWVDFSLKILGGQLQINYKGYQMINETLPPGWPALTAPEWLFAGRTGGANSAHWVDDFYVKVYKPSGPIVSGFEGTPGGVSVSLTDAEGNGLVADSVSTKFDGAAVEASSSKDGDVTTIVYNTPDFLPAGTDHAIEITYSDEKGNINVKTLSFTVPNYTAIDPSSRAASSLKGDSGFIANITQISVEQTGGAADVHGNQIVNAEKQINGEFIDPNTEEAFLNEADEDAFEGWSYYPVVVETVNQNQDAPGAAGNFNEGNGKEDEPIPGIPGWGGSTDGIAGEYIALLDLAKGSYTLGVNSDDGFQATIGANFGDLGAQVLGEFNGGRGASDTTFDIVVTEAGLYPFRVIWFEGGGGANVEIFSMVNGEKTLINDPDVDGSIKAYTIKGATVDESTTDRVDTGRAVLVSVSPANGDKLVKAGSIDVVAKNGSASSIDQSSVTMTLNGDAVTPSVSKSGDTVNITLAPDGGLPVGSHTVVVTMKESTGATKSASTSFYVPSIYKRDTPAPSEAQGGLTVREYHGIGTTDIPVLMANAKFPDSPDATAIAPYFEWPQSGDIEVNPAGNVRDNYGWHVSGFIHPPETGEYIFAVATDDNSQLWLSTDEDPANAVQITQESTWQGVRNFQPSGDETTSAPVLLEAGKAYFVEIITKEGGGGDNMAVAWSLPSDEGADVEAGALPISGDYLSPFTWTGPEAPELSSASPGGVTDSTDYSVSISIANGESVKVAEFTKLEVGGTSILGDAEVTLGNIASSISADASGDPATEYTVVAEWKNTDGSTGSHEYSIMTSPHSEDTLYIETEDFNYDGGEWFTFEDNEGGGAYEGLGAVSGIDFNNSGNASPNYRDIPDNHPGMADSTGFDGSRGDFDMDVDFKMGWNDDGDWYNYTRDFPAAETYYNVIGRFSSGGAAINSTLSVVTGDATAEGHSVEVQGSFKGGPTACWDCMEFFPLRDDDGQISRVKLAGESTVRLTKVGGNMDANYMAFVKSAVQAPNESLADPTEGMVDLTTPGDAVVALLTEDSPGGERVPLAIDNNSQTKYLNFTGKNNTPSGLSISTGGGIVSGIALTSANDAPERDPATYTLSGSNDGSTWTDIASGNVPAFGARFERQAWAIDNTASYTDYKLMFNTTASSNGCCMQVAEVELLTKLSDLSDITSPGDATAALPSEDSPGGERVPNAIDDNAQTKYLNFIGKNNTPSGLSISTGGGVVKGLALTSANDAPERDPATFELKSGDTVIASGTVPAFTERFQRQVIAIDSAIAASDYTLMFNTTASSNGCCMQVAEVELLGTKSAAAPTISVVRNADGTVTVTFDGTLQTAPTVNGPWTDSDAASPLTIPASDAAAFGRAKN